jgi:hypothetical protein
MIGFLRPLQTSWSTPRVVTSRGRWFESSVAHQIDLPGQERGQSGAVR